MKKCRFCDHRAFTDRGEEVCTKYLWYVGDDREDLPCEGFEIALGWQPIAFLVVCVLVIALMVSLL